MPASAQIDAFEHSTRQLSVRCLCEPWDHLRPRLQAWMALLNEVLAPFSQSIQSSLNWTQAQSLTTDLANANTALRQALQTNNAASLSDTLHEFFIPLADTLRTFAKKLDSAI
jgi:hypothetical protein